MILWIKSAIVLLAVQQIGYTASYVLPSDVVKCKGDDNKCILTAINHVMSTYRDGNKDFNLPPLTSIALKNVQISKPSPDTPIQLNFKMPNMVVKGIEQGRALDVMGFTEDIEKSNVKITGIVPNLQLLGDYVADGKILILPLNGDGKADIRVKNLKFTLTTKVKLVTKDDGKKYVQLHNIKAALEADKFQADLENLVNGNKELSESINSVINENWRDVWNELLPGLNKAVASVIKKLTVNIFDSIPYEDLFLKKSA